MFALCILFVLAVKYVTALTSPTAAPTSPPNPYYFVVTYWTDSACSLYAGETAFLMHKCIPQGANSVYVSSSLEVGNLFYTIWEYWTPDTIDCSTSNQYYTSSASYMNCTQSHDETYWFTSTHTSSSDVPSFFPVDGILTKMHSDSSCSSDSVFHYSYQVYGSGLCLPWFDKKVTEAVDCGVLNNCQQGSDYYGADNYGADNSLHYLFQENICSTSLVYGTGSTLSHYGGYIESTCFGKGSGAPPTTGISLVPSICPTVVDGAAGKVEGISIISCVVVVIMFLSAVVYAYYFLVLKGGSVRAEVKAYELDTSAIKC